MLHSFMDQFAASIANLPLFGRKLTMTKRNFAARLAVFYYFMLEGIYDGVWSCFVPGTQNRLHLVDSELGSAALFVFLGIVIATALTAILLRNWGSKPSALLGAVVFSLSLNGMAHAPSLLGLIVALFTYGFTMGIMDVSINSCAILTEIVAGKPLLGTFHGSYSIAAAVGALIGGVLVATQWSIADVFGCISVLTVTLSLAASTLLYNFAQEIKITDIKAEQQASEHEAELGAGRKQLVEQGSTKEGGQTSWLIAFYSIVGFLAAFGESSMLTWSVVYFDRILKVRKEYHSLGFTCFQMSMAVGRFSCDYLRRVVGRRLMFRAAGVLATGGLSLLVLSPMFSPDTRVDGGAASIVAGCVGLSITGLGLSTLIPTSFSSAGHIPGVHPGTAISVVSTFTNAGGILSSPFVGFLSDWFDSLQTALLCDAVLLSIVFVVSWSISVEDHHRMD